LRTKRSPISKPRLTSGETRRPQENTASDQRFRPRERIKRRAEISRVFKKGRSVSCFGARLFFLSNGLAYNRIVITFARKYGNAVKRNRARRLSREAYRFMKDTLKTGYDLVLLVYPRSECPPRQENLLQGEALGKPGLDFAGSARRLKTLFVRAGIQ
jgi:ribonuclease P protein component